MSAELKPVPVREDWEVVCPFGNATVKDTRNVEGSMCATVTFHKPIINRKQYEDDVTVYLERRPERRAGAEGQTWWNVRPSYFSPLTDNAASKLRDFLDEMSDKFDAYRAPLPPEEIRARKMRGLRLEVSNELLGIMGRSKVTHEDLAIVLREALEAAEAGKAYRV